MLLCASSMATREDWQGGGSWVCSRATNARCVAACGALCSERRSGVQQQPAAVCLCVGLPADGRLHAPVGARLLQGPSWLAWPGLHCSSPALSHAAGAAGSVCHTVVLAGPGPLACVPAQHSTKTELRACACAFSGMCVRAWAGRDFACMPAPPAAPAASSSRLQALPLRHGGLPACVSACTRARLHPAAKAARAVAALPERLLLSVWSCAHTVRPESAAACVWPRVLGVASPVITPGTPCRRWATKTPNNNHVCVPCALTTLLAPCCPAHAAHLFGMQCVHTAQARAHRNTRGGVLLASSVDPCRGRCSNAAVRRPLASEPWVPCCGGGGCAFVLVGASAARARGRARFDTANKTAPRRGPPQQLLRQACPCIVVC